MLRSRVTSFVFWVGLCLLAQVAASLLTAGSVTTWYVELQKPVWTPPGWVFGPVWTFLYLSMGISAWLVWNSPARSGLALAVFLLQLGLNVLWSALFFHWQLPGWAFVDITLLSAAILACLVSFLLTNKVAGLLLVPYLGWVLFAAALNFAIWRMN